MPNDQYSYIHDMTIVKEAYDPRILDHSQIEKAQRTKKSLVKMYELKVVNNRLGNLLKWVGPLNKTW